MMTKVLESIFAGLFVTALAVLIYISSKND